MHPLDLQKVSGTQYGQYVEMTPPETPADWQEFLDAGYSETVKVLGKRGLVPVGDLQWIIHSGDEIYPGRTYGWKQTFELRGS